MNKQKNNTEGQLRRDAIELLRDRKFLFRVCEHIEAEGVIGEKENALAIFLAILTATIAPVSALIRGPSSGGKSKLARAVLRLIPEKIVIERTSMSRRSAAYGKGSLDGKVLFVTEQRGGKETQYDLRQLQTEGSLKHEVVEGHGNRRGTKLKRRVGNPVVVSTTTEEQIFEDDETRFLSLWIDESKEQTRAILRSELRPRGAANNRQRQIIQKAVEILRGTKLQFEMPHFFGYVARNVPASIRSRRDWPRFLSICKAIAMIRFHRKPEHANHICRVEFCDYVVAYRLLRRAFPTDACGTGPTAEVVTAVRKIYEETNEPVRAADIVRRLNWNGDRVYKKIKKAVALGLLQYVKGTRPNNVKPILPCEGWNDPFLISPRRVLKHYPKLASCKFIDPITGKRKSFEREHSRSTH